MQTPDAHAATLPSSAWSPFRFRAFTLLWSATLISNIGTWMNDVGAGWLMTELSHSPGHVALVQAATTLPVFLFVLLAGALADRVDKRRYLIGVNIVITIVVIGLALLTAAGMMTPGLLLGFAFLIGTGAAFLAPALQAVVPALVPREHLPPAIALNSLGVNISRAIGPAVAGVLITAVGLSSPFFANALSTLVIIAALVMWRPLPTPARKLPPEPFWDSILTGLRHAAHNDPLKATLLRSFGFFSFVSAFWALLPLIARSLPQGGPGLYGLLLGAVGTGAVGGALLLPGIRARVGINRLTAGGTVASALAMLLLGLASGSVVALIGALLAGLGWIAVLTSLNVSAQMALANWVRARGLSVALMVFYGCMAAGATIWGQIAAATSPQFALILAAAGALLAIPLTWHAKLGQGEGRDLAPAMGWPEPWIAPELGESGDRGPVMVTLTYEIDPQDIEPFLAAMSVLSGERYRDGAHDWGVYQDAASPRTWIEWFFLPSWNEHLRQHERSTHFDEQGRAMAHGFHRGPDAPAVRHYIAPARLPGN